MIQKTSLITLDLNIIAKILPVKHGCTSSETAGSIVGNLFSNNRSFSLLSFRVTLAALFKGRRHLALAEDEDFALALRGLGVFGRDDVGEEESNEETTEDTNISMAISVMFSVV